MQKSSFFGSVGGDRKYKAEAFAEYFSSFIGNGVFPNPAENLMVKAGADMTFTLKAGKAWINGYYYHNTSDMIMRLDNADGILKRIDRIVVRLDMIKRTVLAEIKKGTPASTPSPPELQRDADIYELALADIAVSNGCVQIIQANITDLRLNGKLCGLVTQTIETVDTSQLFAQLESYIENYKNTTVNDFTAWLENYKLITNDDFTDWFDSIKEILNESVAANLLEMINTNADMASDAANIKKGTLDAARLPTTILTTNTAQSISAIKTIFANIIANSQTITPAQLGYLSGVTSSIQTQITNAQNTANTANSAANNAQLSANNAYNLAAGMTSIVSGTYTGNATTNNTTSMEVKLGFKPKAVFVMNSEGKTFETVPNGNNTLYYYHGGLAVPGGNMKTDNIYGVGEITLLEITENGFRVTSFYSGGYSGWNSTLNSGIKYYVAFK